MTSGYRVKRVLPWAMSKWTKYIVTFNEEEDEDTLVEEGPQIERGTVSPRDTRHCEAHPRSIRDKQIPREACFDLGDVKVEKDIVILTEEEDEDSLVEEGREIGRGTVFLGDACHRETHQRNIRDKRLKWTKHIVTFKEEKDEHILVEEGPQIECDTVFHRDTSHREFHPRNIRAKRLLCEACFDQGDVKVENDIVTFNEEQDEDTLVAEGHQIGRGTVFLRDTCQREIHQRNIC